MKSRLPLLPVLLVLVAGLIPVNCHSHKCSLRKDGDRSRSTVATVAEAQAFIQSTEAEYLALLIQVERTEWVRLTYLTDDTAMLGAEAQEKLMAFMAAKAKEATRFDGLDLPEESRRKFKILKLALSMPAPSDPAKRAELASISTQMDAMYGKGKYCSELNEGKCLDLGEMTEILAKSRKWDELLDIWQGWRKISPPMRPMYQRFVELANEGAGELGFGNLAEVWNSRYDMDPADFEAETDRLWEQVKPLYQDLHCYVRARLAEAYGKDKVPPGKPLPAHIMGNMWAQEWGNLFDMLAPEKSGALDIESALEAKKIDEVGMVRIAERFYKSLGLDPLPESFWKRSMFVKPRDREVVCHASAWDIDQDQDLRIKMCIKRTGEDLTTIHHELGHNYYYYYYRHLGMLFRNSANDGFHEAMGDLMALSVTPAYLKEIGIIDKVPDGFLNTLMQRALDKVAFLPFGLLVDKWRWGVFRGQIKPEEYNQAWWDLRLKYQGIVPPVARSESDFDPGAKYHIPGNTPYARYFLAAILQFQFHRALCKAAGHQGPLHTCSLYGNKEIGARIRKMLEMGASRPWPEALKVMTGEEKMDASAILEYFQPLHAWLKEQNKNRQCGW